MGAEDHGDRPDPRSECRRGLWTALLLLVVVAALYLPSTRAGFIYDDHKLILDHPGVHSVGDVAQLFREPHFPRFPYYRPITRTTLLLQKAMHGDVAGPFHAFNALLMGVMAAATFALLRSPGLRLPRGPALLGALALTVHPVASCCVYPICSGRETLMPAVAMVLTLCAHLRSGRLWSVLTVVGLAASLFCKEQAVVLPVLLVLADLLGLGARPPGRSLARWMWRHAPLLAVAVGYAVVRRQLFGGTEFRVALWEDPLGPPSSYLYALQVMLVPFVELVYEPLRAVWFSLPRLLGTLVLTAFVVGVAWRGRRVDRRRLLFWGAWFLVVQLPTANLLEQEARYAERYVLLAALGLVAVGMEVLAAGWRRPIFRRRTVLAGGVVLVALGGVTVGRGIPYRTDRAFAEQWLATNPAAYEASFSLGNLAREEKDPAEAERRFREAIRLLPGFVDAHTNLGLVLFESGRPEEAVRQLEQALQYRPDDFGANAILGNILSQSSQARRALPYLEAALGQDPTSPVVHNDLGVVMARTGTVEQALPHFREALRLDPDHVGARCNLALGLSAGGRRDEARLLLQEGLSRRPGDRQLLDTLGRL